jgi:hypothetical protein
MRGIVTTAVSTAGLIVALAVAPAAHAADKWSLNGNFIATSNGEWAKTNDVYRNEVSLRSIWTISSQCSYPTECTGTVTSDLGWTAPIYSTAGEWYVKHIVPNWITCPDGITTSSALQVFRFRRSTPDGASGDPSSNLLVGEDITTGPSGACGRSPVLYITMPFKLIPQG